ncbi:MAG TPA: heme-binding protein [Solirubrobacteraceae bacterium]|nr:heme-binding protein [Solirubrobacteraceae bacterium]
MHELIERVLIDAEALGAHVAVALSDRWGRRLAFQRQPGTVMTCSAVAIAKAFTACNFDAPTHQLLDTISRHDQEELGRTNPGLVFAGGGFPIRSGGVLLGGIGVSGASSEEDAQLALGALRSAGFETEFGAAAS